jgi:cephalosporin hydroxylase
MNHFWQGIDGWVGENRNYKEAIERAQDGDHFVEVGVFKGRSAAYMAVEIINSGKKITFDAIDHFLGSPEHGDVSHILYDATIENLKPVADYVNIIRQASPEASVNYKDNSLAFIFIDGGHDYDSVMADLHAWWPKVKSGGYFSGDDYQPSWPGVIQAVNDFSKEVNLPFKIVPDTIHWIFQKN